MMEECGIVEEAPPDVCFAASRRSKRGASSTLVE
jgi:hypothetical protein